MSSSNIGNVKSLSYLECQINKIIDILPKQLSDLLSKAEQKSQIKKIYLVYIFLGCITLWLLFGYGAEILCNIIGFAYPAFCSIRALESKTIEDDKQWLMYWVVFALFSLVEFFSDLIVGWLPFYWLVKCSFLLWCMGPTRGATSLYNGFVRPYFAKHHTVIDDALNNAKSGIRQFAKNAVASSTNDMIE